MKFFAYIILFASVIACNTNKTEYKTDQTAIANDITLKDFDVEAANFVGKEVRVSGIVDHVCKHGGKKLLLVNNDAKVHVTSEERFSEDLIGSEINLVGVVKEERITEATCLQMEEDNLKSHSEGMSSDAQYEAKKEHIATYRKMMADSGKDHVSNFSLAYVSLKEKEPNNENKADSKVE